HALRHPLVTGHGRPSAPDTTARKSRTVKLPVVKTNYSQPTTTTSDSTTTKAKTDPFAKAPVVEDSVNSEPVMPDEPAPVPLQPSTLNDLPDYAQAPDSAQAVAATAVPVTNADVDPLAELRAKLAEQGIT